MNSDSPYNPVFEVSGLKKIYNDKIVLDIPQLTINTGKIYCLYGPNGSGKSTLFEILLHLKNPTDGKILFKGKEVHPRGDAIPELRSQVTMVHQNPLLFDTTVEKNIDYGLRIRKVNKSLRKKRVGDCLNLVGLEDFQKRWSRELSGGEIQRVAIARALAINPAVLFLDEFSANIDRTTVTALEKIIKKINQQLKTTIVFTTHYLDQAYRLADNVLHLFEGKVVQSPLKNLYRGKIERTNGAYLFKSENIQISVVSSQEGNATIVIPSESISISKNRIESSMRNCLAGRIKRIIDDGLHLQLIIMAGELFEVMVTKESYYEMGLKPGMDVYINFKASSVEVL